VISIDE
jgi:hypothetical protein